MSSNTDVALGKTYVRVVTGVHLEAVLFGILTAALLSTLYLSFRPGIRSYFIHEKASLARLVAFILFYAIFTCHWIFSIKNALDFLNFLSNADAYTYSTVPYDAYLSYGPVIAESVFFGIFCALVTLAVYVLVRKGLRARSQQTMLAAVLLMYAISLSHWVLQLPFLLELAHLSEWDIRDTVGLISDSLGPMVLLSVNVVLSDAIVLWRMCVLYDDDIFVRTLAVLLLLSTIGCTAANLATEALFVAPDINTAISFSFTTYGTTVLVLSLASNVIATWSIGWRVWQYRRDISAHLASFNHRSIVEKIMTIFAESGCIYCILWVLYMLDSVGISQRFITNSHSVFGSGDPVYFRRLMPQLTGIYPTIIIVIVALEQSYLENAFSESKLSAFVAARPIATQPRSSSRSRGMTMSWMHFHSGERDAREIHLESINLDAPAAAVADESEADGIAPVATVKGKDDRARTARRTTQGNSGSPRSVHAEPRQTVDIQDLKLRSSMVQGDSASCDIVVHEPRQAHLSSSSSFSSTTRTLVVARPRQASYLSTLDFGASILAHIEAYDIRKTSEDAGREGECLPVSPGSDRRAPSPARRSV